MGCSREQRKSEKMFSEVMNKMLALNNCVWRGKILLEEAEEYVVVIKRELDEMIEQMKNE